MSSFNNVTKVLYKDNQDAIVSLLEYILFENTKDSQKYLVFKFNNNLNQALREIKFEISEFDSDGALIEKALVEYKDFEAQPGASFVPNAKLKVNFDCKTIKAKLLYAKFERIAWNEGAYEPVEYTINEFRSDFTKDEKGEALTAKQQRKRNKMQDKLAKAAFKGQLKEEKLLAKKRHFISKEFINSNKTKAPRVAAILMVIGLIIYLGVSIFYFNQSNLQFYENGFSYEVSSYGATVVEYDGADYDITIPAKAGDYNVIAIGENAFENDNVEVLHFSDRIAILDNAFRNCYNLQKVYGAELITRVGDYAFENCKQLRDLDLASATYIGKGAFQGCDSLSTITATAAMVSADSFKECNNLSALSIREAQENQIFKNIFGGIVPSSLYDVKIGARSFISGFFDNMENVKVEMINEDEATFEYGALKGLGLSSSVYTYTDSFEVYKDHIVAINTENSLFHIPSGLKHLKEDLDKFRNELATIKTLRVDPQKEPVDRELMSMFNNIESLEYNPETDFFEDAFSDNYSLNTLVLNSNDRFTSGIDARLDHVTNLVIKGNGSINSGMFIENCFSFVNIRSLKIEESERIEPNALSSLIYLSNLEMPAPRAAIDSFGISKSLNSLRLTTSSNNKLYSSYIKDYTNLTSLELPTSIEEIGDSFITNTAISTLILPEGLKRIGDRFINNCYNLYTLTLNSDLEAIGSYFINDTNLYSLHLPQSLREVGSYLINNTGISDLAIPSSVSKMGTPLLGADSYVNTLEVPFINASSYKSFNLNYALTTTLTINSDVWMAPGLLSDLPKLSKLVLNGKCENIQKNIFKGNYELKDLEINGSFSCDLKDMFGVENVYLDRLVISSPKLPNKFFANAKIMSLAIKDAEVLDVDLFANVDRIERLYIPSDTQRNVINYNYLAKKVGYLATGGRLSEEAKKELNAAGVYYEEEKSLDLFY